MKRFASAVAYFWRPEKKEKYLDRIKIRSCTRSSSSQSNLCVRNRINSFCFYVSQTLYIDCFWVRLLQTFPIIVCVCISHLINTQSTFICSHNVLYNIYTIHLYILNKRCIYNTILCFYIVLIRYKTYTTSYITIYHKKCLLLENANMFWWYGRSAPGLLWNCAYFALE